MGTIQATVNIRLLSKATRLFTGTLGGRVVEVLQNARRAEATEVAITNGDGYVTVCDNGRGIGDTSHWWGLLEAARPGRLGLGGRS